MVTTKLNLSMTEPQVRQIYAKQGDTGRVLDITLDQTPEDGTLRILRPDGTEVTSEAVTGGEVSESGETVTFDSLTEADVTELTVGIEPVQDLNGYDAPWVGGAGKNKLNFNRATTTLNGVTFTNNGDGTYTVSGTSTAITVLEATVTLGVAQGTQLILNGCPSGGSANTYALDTYGTDISLTRDYGSGGTFTANGSTQVFRIVVFANVTMNNLVFKPMIRLATETDAAFAPYSNICPITGHTEVNVTRMGKNLFDKANGAKNLYVGGGNVTGSGGTLLCFLAKKGTQYTISMTGGNRTNLYYYDTTSLDDIVSGITLNVVTLSAAKPYTFIADHDAVYCYYADTYFQQTVADSCMVELGSTATAYEPYQGSTYTTSLGQTVYGGTLDMVSGVLTVDKAMVDLGSLTWLLNSSLNGKPAFYVRLDDAKTVSASSVADMTTSCYSVISADNLYIQKDNTGIIALNGQNYLQVRDTRYSTASAYKSGITGQTLVYELATPQIYTLTAQQIKTLVGTNNVWASSGDIVNITFTYGGLLSELPSEATEIVGKCYCDIEQNGVSSMPFTLNVKKNERQ